MRFLPAHQDTPCLSVTPPSHLLAGNDTVTLKCQSSQSGPKRYTFKNANGDITVQENNTFTIESISESDAGSYSCGTVSEGLESALSTVVLNVKGKK